MVSSRIQNASGSQLLQKYTLFRKKECDCTICVSLKLIIRIKLVLLKYCYICFTCVSFRLFIYFFVLFPEKPPWGVYNKYSIVSSDKTFLFSLKISDDKKAISCAYCPTRNV